MRSRGVGAPCDSCAVSLDYTNYEPCTDASHAAGPRAERRPRDVISDHAFCFALNGCASGGLVN